MKILVIGSGLIGPAAAFNAMSDPEVSQVTLCDMNQTQLEQASEHLARLPHSEKLNTVTLDLNDQVAAKTLFSGYDAIVAALPSAVSGLAIRLAVAADTPLVDLSRPATSEVEALKSEVEAQGGFIILSCGLEPGLTEIMARHLADQLDRIDELHIKCGGIPAHPKPPLNYKIVFGGRRLPLRESDALMVVDGKLVSVARYSGVETVAFADISAVEAWHEGFMPWLLELPALQHLKFGTQKTIRWPGYAAKVTALKEMGLLSLEPIQVDGVMVRPKHLLDAVMYPHVKLEDQEQDITIFRVEVSGRKDGDPRRYKMDMIDYYDQATGMTSMARTTGYTGAIVARMIARGDLDRRGIWPPEQLITGPLFDRLVDELAAVGINFEMTTEKVQGLRRA